MADKAMDTYLNDHLSGSVLGSDLADHISEQADGSLSALMTTVAADIHEDRDTLIALMERLGTTRNPVKQAAAWAAEKTMWVKLSGLSSGEGEHGLFMALETLSLGIEGKACMWRALKAVRDEYDALSQTDLDRLVRRAEEQRAALEPERLALARAMFDAADAAS